MPQTRLRDGRLSTLVPARGARPEQRFSHSLTFLKWPGFVMCIRLMMDMDR